ncbi:glycosyltransferase [Flavobacteriaceae bacterium GSB9]|nr:glycosyltransferase [Flavobacteriaceae bacterium GSB9]
MQPLVSIIVPCYNQAQYLDECLQSVLSQTYTNWECVIVNDGSTDTTSIVAETWLDKDSRFKYLSHDNAGVSQARNFGIENAKGTYVLPLDADDLIADNYLDLAIQAFKDNTNLKIVYAKAQKFGDINEDWNLPKFKFKTLLKGNIIFNCAMYKRQDWETIGGYDPSFDIGLEDWDFWLSLLKNDAEVYQIPEICFFYRINNASRNHSIVQSQLDNLYKKLTLKHLNSYIEAYGSYKSLLTEIDNLKRQNKRLQKKVDYVAEHKTTRLKAIIKKILGL